MEKHYAEKDGRKGHLGTGTIPNQLRDRSTLRAQFEK
jgi:hypothetical protein